MEQSDHNFAAEEKNTKEWTNHSSTMEEGNEADEKEGEEEELLDNSAPLDTFLDKFADQTDLMGVGHLSTSAILTFSANTVQQLRKRHRLEQIFWFLVILGCVAATIWQLAGVFGKYLAFAPASQISIGYKTPLDFPSVTVCNLNPIRKSMLYKDPTMENFFKKQIPKSANVQQCQLDSIKTQQNKCKKKKTEMKYADTLDENSGGGFDYYSGNSEDDYYTEPEEGAYTADFGAMKKYLTILGNMKKSTRIAMGTTAKSLIQSCTFKGKACSYKDFSLVLVSDYNVCWEFNGATERNKQPKLTSFSGPLLGLQLVLYSQERDYNDGFLDSSGFRVLIHPFNTMALPKEDGFYVDAGTDVNVGIRLTNMSYLEAPYNDPTCENDDRFMEMYKVKYTRSACTATCLERSIAKNCSCLRPAFIDSYPIANRTLPNCNMSNPLIANCIQDLTNQTNNGDLSCETDCPTPCQVNVYSSQMSSIEWPTDSKWAELVLGVCKSDNVSTDCNYFVDMQNQFLGMNAEEIAPFKQGVLRDNFATVSIYYSELNLETIAQQPAYDVTQLGADIGGAAGLWIGLCAFSGVEMIVFIIFGLWAYIKSICSSRDKKSRPSTSVNKVHVMNSMAIKS